MYFLIFVLVLANTTGSINDDHCKESNWQPSTSLHNVMGDLSKQNDVAQNINTTGGS